MRGFAMLALSSTLVLAVATSQAGGRVTERTQAPVEARALSRAFADVARAVGPSVVRIEVVTPSEQATASGIILDTRGNVVTSSHVIEGAAGARITIVLLDGRRLVGDLVGSDGAADVAVVRMLAAPADVSAARFGDSDRTEVGEWVLSVGSPLGLEQTITAGIVSGRAHVRGSNPTASNEYLQTDAKVNPGNSGGPIVNLEGEVVGLSALISAGPGGSYGYAVPINQVRRTATVLIRDGRPHHPYIGVILRDVRAVDWPERQRWGALPPWGALVSRVWSEGPAGRAGLREGDVITSINNEPIGDPGAVVQLVSSQEVGTEIVVGYSRAGTSRSLSLAVAEQPFPGDAAAN